MELQNRSNYSYPVVHCPMKKNESKEEHYTKIFKFLKRTYFEFSGEELSPKRICLDFEKAAINSFVKNFPSSRILLCSVHFVRNIKKWFNNNMGKLWSRDEGLLDVIRIIRSVPFIPFVQYPFLLDILKKHLNFMKFMIGREFADNYQIFLDSYLFKLYLNPTGVYTFRFFDFFIDFLLIY